MGNEQLRNDMSDDRNTGGDAKSRKPATRDGNANATGAPGAATNPATMPTKPCVEGDTCDQPGQGAGQQARMQQPGASPRPPFAAGEAGSKGQGSDGYGGAGSGGEHTRGAHPRGEPAQTRGDRHPGAGYDDNAAEPTRTGQQPLPQPQLPGRPKGQRTGQQPVSAGEAGGATTNRPGGNPQVPPRLDEKTKTYEGPTGVAGEAGSNADDV